MSNGLRKKAQELEGKRKVRKKVAPKVAKATIKEEMVRLERMYNVNFLTEAESKKLSQLVQGEITTRKTQRHEVVVKNLANYLEELKQKEQVSRNRKIFRTPELNEAMDTYFESKKTEADKKVLAEKLVKETKRQKDFFKQVESDPEIKKALDIMNKNIEKVTAEHWFKLLEYMKTKYEKKQK